MKLPCTLLSAGLLAVAPQLWADVTVPPLFSDHAVLLKGPKVPVWGKADPGEKVTVTLDGTSASAEAKPNGTWSVTLNLKDKTQGPFELTIEGKNKITAKDVLVGEVWVCSGQSNMEWILKNTIGGAEEIADSTNPMLRHFAVKKATSVTPLDKFEGSWAIAGPETSGGFTAVGYWFGKTLQKALNAPVGLVHTSWGGTPSEAWTSADAIDKDEHLKKRKEESTAAIEKSAENKAAYAAELTKWVQANQRTDRPVEAVPSFVSAPTDDWEKVKLPGKLSGGALPDAGVVWVRREVEVPAAAEGKNGSLEFELTNGLDTVFWNGKQISSFSLEKIPNIRHFVSIPADQIKAGTASLAIRIYEPVTAAEFTGTADRLRVFGKSLGGEWLAKGEQSFTKLDDTAMQNVPKAPKDAPGPQNVPTYLYNAMIQPLLPYAIRGAIWYQGESNAGRAFAYQTAFPMMITDWRTHWGQGDFPFYFCQLANYQPKKAQPGDDAWAELRDAQSMTRKLPKTGMAVLIDIGETKDIHPRNKKDAGERLAAIALAQDYGKKIPFAGPAFESMKIGAGKAVIKLKNIEGGLVAKPLPAEEIYQASSDSKGPLVAPMPNSELQGFAICGEDKQWKWANAMIEGDTVVVWSEEVPTPVAVRYAWTNNPTCNLYNKAGFPAEPFRTDDFPLTTIKALY